MTTNLSGTNQPERAEVGSRDAGVSEQPRFADLARWGVGVLLVIHGIVHVFGPLDMWGIADIEELSGEPAFDIGSTTADALAVAWLLALVLLVTAGLAVLARRAWWRTAAIVGVIASQFAIIVWWADAAAGTVANVLIVVAVALAGPLSLCFDPSQEAT
jgi:hypothetical protein